MHALPGGLVPKLHCVVFCHIRNDPQGDDLLAAVPAGWLIVIIFKLFIRGGYLHLPVRLMLPAFMVDMSFLSPRFLSALRPAIMDRLVVRSHGGGL